MGDRFIPYDAFTNNCQDFVAALLAANGLASPEALAWLKMDTATLAEAIPATSRAVANTITHVGAVADKLVGNGRRSERATAGPAEQGRESELEALVGRVVAGALQERQQDLRGRAGLRK
jgi:hypothetical protein